MHEMDLIPASYRAQRARRLRQRIWVLALAVWVVTAVGARLWIERGLAQERTLKAQWQPLQEKARSQRAELQQLQTLIEEARLQSRPANMAAELAVEQLPSILSTLAATGLRLNSATFEPAQDAPARLTLMGQASDEATLGRAVSVLQAHTQVTQVQLLSIKPATAPGPSSHSFEMLVRVTSPAASAASAATAPATEERP